MRESYHILQQSDYMNGLLIAYHFIHTTDPKVPILLQVHNFLIKASPKNAGVTDHVSKLYCTQVVFCTLDYFTLQSTNSHAMVENIPLVVFLPSYYVMIFGSKQLYTIDPQYWRKGGGCCVMVHALNLQAQGVYCAHEGGC